MSAAEHDNTLATQIRAEVESRREAIVELCRAVVTAPSVNPPGDTREVAARVQSFFDMRGISAESFRVVDEMPSVVVHLDSGRPGKHLLFNAHLDTMPPGPDSLWSVPPFDVTRADGRLYGLGMGNMKGAVVAMSHAVDILAQRTELWRGSLTFAAVSDEVVFGPNGAEALITQRGLTGDALICGEGPGFRRLSNGEKGVLWVSITVESEPGHSSSVTRGTSAAALVARVVTVVDDMIGWRGEETWADFVQRRSHEPPETGPRETFLTANAGIVEAGSFIGQVATRGHVDVDFRIPPGLTIADILGALDAGLRDANVTADVSTIKGWEANVTDPSSEIVEAWRRATSALGIPFPEFAIRLPASDASRWRRLGVPAICYGPQPLLSSGIDDYADEDEVLNCVMLYVMSACEFLA